MSERILILKFLILTINIFVLDGYREEIDRFKITPFLKLYIQFYLIPVIPLVINLLQ